MEPFRRDLSVMLGSSMDIRGQMEQVDRDLGYTWDNLLNNALRLRLYGACQNPFVITKYKGLDPEVFSGIDNNIYPRPVSFTLGLIATF